MNNYWEGFKGCRQAKEAIISVVALKSGWLLVNSFDLTCYCCSVREADDPNYPI